MLPKCWLLTVLLMINMMINRNRLRWYSVTEVYHCIEPSHHDFVRRNCDGQGGVCFSLFASSVIDWWTYDPQTLINANVSSNGHKTPQRTRPTIQWRCVCGGFADPETNRLNNWKRHDQHRQWKAVFFYCFFFFPLTIDRQSGNICLPLPLIAEWPNRIGVSSPQSLSWVAGRQNRYRHIDFEWQTQGSWVRQGRLNGQWTLLWLQLIGILWL